jgi:hypothetical protein
MIVNGLTIEDCRREIERLRQQARLHEGVGERVAGKAMRGRIDELEDIIRDLEIQQFRKA